MKIPVNLANETMCNLKKPTASGSEEGSHNPVNVSEGNRSSSQNKMNVDTKAMSNVVPGMAIRVLSERLSKG